jgi:hypothetical protein
MTQELIEDRSRTNQRAHFCFREELSAVSFPISARYSRKFAEQVRSKAMELQDAQAKISSIKESLDASQNELLQKAIKGLSYAKVFAEDREELVEKLSSISLGGKSSSSRKRAPKAETTDNDGEETSGEKRNRSKKNVVEDTPETDA